MSFPAELFPFALIRWQRRHHLAADYRFVVHDAGLRLCSLYDLSQSEQCRWPRLDLVPETVIASAFGNARIMVNPDPAALDAREGATSQAVQERGKKAWRIMCSLLGPDEKDIAQAHAKHAIFLDPVWRRERFVAAAARYRVPVPVVATIFARYLRYGGTREAVMRPRMARSGQCVKSRPKPGLPPC